MRGQKTAGEPDHLAQMMMTYQDMPLREVVFRTLRRGILRGDLKPGERLMEIQLAERLGVSRTPIREAIRMLELDGMVTNVPRKGAQVASITEKDLRDVLEVREWLEQMAVHLACERITEEELAQLHRASRRFAQMVEDGAVELTDLAEADEEFHATIYRATGNRRLMQLLSNLREQMYRYRVEYLKDIHNRQTLIEEHDALWRGLTSRDAAQAEMVMRQHIERQMRSIQDTLQEASC